MKEKELLNNLSHGGFGGKIINWDNLALALKERKSHSAKSPFELVELGLMWGN
jgi:hypothetical protein